jgi:hypothetical protein
MDSYEGFARWLAGYIEVNLLSEWGEDVKLSEEEVFHLEKTLRNRMGMYFEIVE